MYYNIIQERNNIVQLISPSMEIKSKSNEWHNITYYIMLKIHLKRLY